MLLCIESFVFDRVSRHCSSVCRRERQENLYAHTATAMRLYLKINNDLLLIFLLFERLASLQM